MDFLASDGLRLRVEVAGPEHAPTVVLVHGLAASIEVGWVATGVRERLVGAGLRTVAFDARAHGGSEGPRAADRYGDHRAAADLTEIVDSFAGPDANLAGYSMGSATILVALEAGLVARAAVLGATSSAVLEWTDRDEAQVESAVAALEGRPEAEPALQWWIGFLDATGADKAALAALLRGHRPVIRDWETITAPIVVAAGTEDTMAAPSAELLARLPHASRVDLPGDHLGAAASPAFTDAIVRAARS